MFVDSHCHLDCIDLAEFDGELDVLVKTAVNSGVEHMLCVSITLDEYRRMYEKVAAYSQVSVSAGVHPMADREQQLDADVLYRIAQDEKVVAIGETGLDYYYHKDGRQWQQDRFRIQVQCAVDLNKPVIVHTRDAWDDTLTILREERADKCHGVIHCFTETMDFAEKAIELGFMISFSGIVTFNNAKALREVAARVPEESLLIETDSPYLAPVPCRGKQNNPSMVRHVAETLAEVRGTSVEHIAEVTADNFYRLFNIHKSGKNNNEYHN